MMYQFAQLLQQGIADPSHSMMNKGGGGSAPSNPDTRYANLDALYGTQNQASQFMLNNAMPYIPTLTENSAGMVQEAMDGTLANQLAQRAGNDAAATMGSALDANNRNMQRYGMGVSANRLLSEGNRNAIMGAGMKAGEMNKARLGAEDMKWNRNANFYGQVMGMNNGAMQGMSNAGAGLSNIANQQSANDRANAAGYGQAGAAFSNALFKADGGAVNAPKLANGGNAWEAYKAANPVQPMVSGSGSRRSSGNGFNQFIAGAAPQMLGAGLRDIMNLDGKGGKIAKNAKDAYKWAAGKMAPTNSSSISMQGAPEYANSQLQPVDMTGFEPGADMMAGANATGAATEMGANAAAGAAAADAALSSASAYSAFAPEAATLTGQVGTGLVETAATSGSTDIGFNLGSGLAAAPYAKGGAVKKKGAQCLAMGGMPSMQKMSVADNANVAGLDSNASLSVVKMNDPVKPNNAKPTGNAPGYWGNTDGMGETSYGDKDGFGKYHGDNRHLAGNIAMTVFGGYPGLGTLAHPIAEPMTRAMISTGDKVGGVTGAILMDPIGTSMSGKYKPEDIAKGNLAIAAGVPWAGKFLADGGEARIDYTPGGKVSGPGTETSDDIPAWLSDGEYVLNAEAVKMVGKKKLDKINKAGLKKRGDEDAKPGLKDADLALGSGGFANLGIALGAGVDQMNRQQMIDQRNQELEMRKQEAEQRRQEYEYQRQQREANAQAQAGARSAMEDATAMAGLPEQLRNRTDLTPEEKANAIRAYRDAGYTPEALAKKAGLELGKVDIGRGMELQNKLIAQQQAERRARVGGLLGAGDYAGLADVMSNNDFNPDGKAYKFTGVEKGKDGNEYVRFNVNGVDQRVDKRMLPGLVEASLDPAKGIEYTREVGKITDQDADRKLRDKQIGISAGHLGLANSKWAMEKEELTTERKVKAKIRELRESLSNTKDEAEREAIKLKIADLDPSTDRGESNRYFLSNVDTGEQDQLGNPIKRTMRIDRKTGDVSDIKPTVKPQASSNFEIGKVYADAAGNKAKWNGKSWDPVK